MVDIAQNGHTTTIVGTVPLTAPTDLGGRAVTTGVAARPSAGASIAETAAGPTTSTTVESGRRTGTAVRYALAGVRLTLGWIFLWAFLDKMFGLGHDTPSAKSWINGGSPTKGFLGSAANGPFSSFYHSIAGNGAVDVLFMTALLGIGVALILGIGMRIAAGVGVLLTVMMWSAVLPPASNPFIDDHIVYAGVLIVLALLAAGDTLGFGPVWARTPLVRRASWLK